MEECQSGEDECSSLQTRHEDGLNDDINGPYGIELVRSLIPRVSSVAKLIPSFKTETLRGP